MGRIALVIVLAVVLAACGSGAGHGSAGTLDVTVRVGPTCPVEEAGTPCDLRPPARVTLQVVTGDGQRVAARTVRSGRVSIGGLEEGRYRLVARPAVGLLGTPAPVPFTITGGRVTHLRLTYDTGIR
jgi:hypothetical protein